MASASILFHIHVLDMSIESLTKSTFKKEGLFEVWLSTIDCMPITYVLHSIVPAFFHTSCPEEFAYKSCAEPILFLSWRHEAFTEKFPSNEFHRSNQTNDNNDIKAKRHCQKHLTKRASNRGAVVPLRTDAPSGHLYGTHVNFPRGPFR